jgi:hypothetical protein
MHDMEVKLALLADYANVTREGKLNLMGIFDVINASHLPWTQPQMRIVLTFEANPAEWNTQKKVQIKLLDADAHERFTMGADLKVPAGKSGRNVPINSIIVVNNLRFEVAGDYVFCVFVGEENKREIPLTVNFIPRPDTT